ncbi:PREDICTED: regucalcin-like isoform X3 [Ceratosolen solmsi marchali]|uniref:Regucalcin-like isoform X3 n=1 Tax=Ceratosolen solmsi marchali TaxID=326594 RepID=A0AAJ6YJV9_9HYME|nr:PREDICTED: regucalcin-like isoform X3 [Ceratosolen solmsi marchali]
MNIVTVKILGFWIFTLIIIFDTASMIRIQENPNEIMNATSDFTISVVSPPLLLGEGPFWSSELQKLYFVDIIGEKIYSYDPNSEQTVSASVGTMGKEINSQVTPNRGSLYSIDQHLVPKKHLSPVSISNGIAWNIEYNIMYYIDSPTRKITAFEYDIYNGTISNPRIVFDFDAYNLTGVPDGMTIDKDNNLWVANYGAGRVLNIDPRHGKLLRTIEIPSQRVTSVAFGGLFLDILYITTASADISLEEKKSKPFSGCVFAVRGLGVCGFTPNKFKLHKSEL